MNQANQVAVELKLTLDSFKKQIRAAADLLKQNLSQSSNQVAPAIEKAGKATDDLTSKTKKAVSEARNLQKAWLDAIRAGKDVPGQRPVSINAGKPDYSQYGPSMNPTEGPMPPGAPGGGLATAPPKLNAPATNKTSMLMIAAQVGAALAGVRVAIGLLGYAARMAMIPVRALSAEIASAAQLYAKALQSGAGMMFTARSNAFAAVLGVSERDVFKYADAIKYLNERMSGAIKATSGATKELTSVNWEWGMLKYELNALFMVLAKELAPSLRLAISGFRDLVRVFREFADSKLFKLMTLLVKYNPGLYFGQLLPRLLGLGSSGKAALDPVSSMHRLASSSWEKMGLVMGHGGVNHAQLTANNTRRISVLMEHLVNHFKLEKEKTPKAGYSAT